MLQATFLDPSEPKEKYDLRVHVYQAQDLPAADANGLCDPYIKLSIGGREQRTTIQYETRFPHWQQTIVFQNLDLPRDSRAIRDGIAPEVTLQLYDHDNTFDDYMGRCTFSLQSMNDAHKKPKWYPWQTTNGTSTHDCGQVLLSFQLMSAEMRSTTETLDCTTPQKKKPSASEIQVRMQNGEPITVSVDSHTTVATIKKASNANAVYVSELSCC